MVLGWASTMPWRWIGAISSTISCAVVSSLTVNDCAALRAGVVSIATTRAATIVRYMALTRLASLARSNMLSIDGVGLVRAKRKGAAAGGHAHGREGNPRNLVAITSHRGDTYQKTKGPPSEARRAFAIATILVISGIPRCRISVVVAGTDTPRIFPRRDTPAR